MNLTLEEKYQIVIWHHNGVSEARIRILFGEMFPNRPIPTRAVIRSIMNNLRRHGCLSGRHHREEQPRRPLNPDRELRDIMICASVEQNASRSLVDIAREFGISKDTVRNILKKNGYKSYKLQRANEITPDDLQRRMEFCERVMDMANRSENFIQNILFTDESSFPIHGRHNPSVHRYWSRDNQHRIYDARTQRPQKLNVWAGILGNNVVGPFFINGTLNTQRYLELLQNDIIPAVRNLNVAFDSVWFQQDGCPAHNSVMVREYLNEMFPGRLIAGFRNMVMEEHVENIPPEGIPWPARSPDLAPCDFFLWGYTKTQIYGFQEQRATTLDELRQRIVDALAGITPEMLANVRRSFYNRLGYCSASFGGRFEHFI